MTVTFKKKLIFILHLKIFPYLCVVIKKIMKTLSNMYISSVSVTFSSKDSISLHSTSLTLDHTVGCTLLHALNFVYGSPIVKSYLRKNYYIANLTFKYSKISSYENFISTMD